MLRTAGLRLGVLVLATGGLAACHRRLDKTHTFPLDAATEDAGRRDAGCVDCGGNNVFYYVSPSGSDQNPGTYDQPFATVAHARDVVEPLTASMTADIHVVLRGGTYPQQTTLDFGSTHSGQNGHAVIYEANGYGTAGAEAPVVSGGV